MFLGCNAEDACGVTACSCVGADVETWQLHDVLHCCAHAASYAINLLRHKKNYMPGCQNITLCHGVDPKATARATAMQRKLGAPGCF